MDSIRSRFNRVLSTPAARAILMFVMGLLVIAVLSGAIVSKYLITIIDGDDIITIYTSEILADSILAEQNIALLPNDTYKVTEQDGNKKTIEVMRAKQVNIEADSTIVAEKLVEGTVEDALELANVQVGNADLINVSLTEPIVDGMHIIINRVTYETVVTEEEIPYEVQEIKTPTLRDNKRKTLKAGENGTLETVVNNKLVDGIIVETEQIATNVTAEPVSARVLVGDSDTAVSRLVPNFDLELDENGNPVSYKQKIVGKATAYSALGRSTSFKAGNVAMDFSRFPKGTQLYIKTPDGSFIYGYSVVKDTGHALVNGDILVDLFFDSYKESCLFGAKNVEVYVLN